MKTGFSFRLLWIGQTLANLGDALYTIAIVTAVYQATELAQAAAVVPVLRVAAQLISSWLAPLMMDRFPIKSLLVLSQAGQTVFLSVLAVLLLSSFPIPAMFIWMLLVFLVSFLDGWTRPCRNAMVPRLVPPDRLVQANSQLALSDQTVLLVGWSLGGVAVVWVGEGSLIAGAVLLFALSSLSLRWIRVPSSREPFVGASKWEKVRIGWVTLWSDPRLRTLTAMDLLETAAGSIWIGAIILVFVKEVLQQGEAWWGFINAANIAGMMVGGLVAWMCSRSVDRHPGIILVGGSLVVCMFSAVFALNTDPWIALTIVFFMGPCYQMREIVQRSLLQQWVSPTVLPKVLAAHGSLMFMFFGLSVWWMGLLADEFGVRSVYRTAAVLYGVSAFLAWKMKRNLGMRFEKGTPWSV